MTVKDFSSSVLQEIRKGTDVYMEFEYRIRGVQGCVATGCRGDSRLHNNCSPRIKARYNKNDRIQLCWRKNDTRSLCCIFSICNVQ